MKTQQRIMVIDDDPVVGQSFERVLTSKGYAVINCHSGEEALVKLQNEEYDAVFTDLKMPGMDGMEVATQVKAHQPWMPVIIVTGYGSAAYEAQAKNIGVSEFMRKPLSPDMIEESADKAMLVKEAFVEIAPKIIEVVEITKPAIRQQSKAIAIALFLAAPFIGLLYALALPFVGLAMLAMIGGKAFAKTQVFPKIKNAALFIVSPFIGLAYAVALPFVGIGMIAYTGIRAALK
jgi:CheY-like chemotaxis protein